VLHHAGEFDQMPQRNLSPLTTHLGASERVNQIACLSAERLLAGHHGLQLRRNAAVRLVASFFQRADMRFSTTKRIADRLDEVLDGLFA
jgi:hypothetical protein